MAGDRFDWDIVVRLATEGVKSSKGDVEGFTKAVDEMSRTGKVSEKAAESASRAFARQGKAAGDAATSARTLEKAQSELNKALENQSTEKSARGLDTIQAAQLRLTKATADRQKAEQQLANSGGGQSRVDATRDLTTAVKAQTTAENALAAAHKNNETSVISLRYANYDLASSMFALSAAVTAAGVGVVAAFASQESAFTNVQRTAEGALGNIRDRLTELSTQIPFSFNQLAEIATLGNQLGIAAKDLEAFTTTVAQFSTVTGISAEQAALAFGKLGNLLGVGAQDYDRLASSIALVGRTTAATEAQIVSVAGEIAPAAAAAGFTADQVIGLSGALASLKVPPERSRSTILQFFETLNMAVAEGGDKLENFARVVGVSASELESMVRSGQGQDILSRFVGNASDSDTIEITQALEKLGLAGLRTNPTIRALAGNMDLLNGALADGKQGWTENTELQRQMAFILDDLSTKWQTFLNAAMNAGAAIGSSVGPTFGIFLDTLKNILIALTGFAQSDFGQAFFRVISVIGMVVAAYATLRGGIALATASLQAFSLISSALGGAGIMAGLRGLATAFGVVRGSAVGAATGIGATATASTVATGAMGRLAGAARVAGSALVFLGRATIIIGLLQAASALIFDFGGSMQWLARITTQVVGFIGAQLSKTALNIAQIADALSSIVPGMSAVATTLRKFAISTQINAAAGTLTKGFTEWAGSLKTADDGLGDLGDTAGGIPFGDYADGAEGFGDSLGGVGDAAKGAAQEVRTLVDYANDLQSVFSRAFDLRFSSGSTLDAITSTFITMREATEESARNIAKLKAEIQGLQSDINIQKIFLGVATEYGDAARAEAIQANIAKLQADLADKTANLSDEQDKNSKTLTGNSKAAIANRKQMEDLVKQYQDHLVALASSGLSQADLARKSQQLRAEFIQQATQLGYNAAEVDKYAHAFDDLTIIINRIPRNITVTANTNPALQALNEFVAQAKTSIGSGLSIPVTSSFDDQGTRKQARAADLQTKMQEAINNMIIAAGAGNYAASAVWAGAARNFANILKSGSYATGGFTGNGGKYEPAGIVHRGEYVVPKKDVNQRTGLPYADAMGRLQRGASGPGYAGGGFVRGGGAGMGAGQIASLGPMAMQQFSQMFAQYMRVYLDGQVVARSAANQFSDQTAVGAY